MSYLPSYTSESVRTDPYNNYVSTSDTIHKMQSLVRQSVGSPLVVAAGNEILQGMGKGPNDVGQDDIIRGCYWWTKHNIHFKLDEDSMQQDLGIQDLEDGKELLFSPVYMLQMINAGRTGQGNGAIGDCDDFSMLLACMLLQLGISKVAFCTIAADPTAPDDYSHVYVKVKTDKGALVALDASRHGQFPGWEAKEYYHSALWWI